MKAFKKTIRKIHYLPIAMLIAAVFSCTLETSQNGALDGYWKLCSVDTIATNGQRDFTEVSIFWSIQHTLLMVRDNADPLREYVFHFTQTSDSLKLFDASAYDKQNGDSILTYAPQLAPYGINKLAENFHIDHLSTQRLDLTTDNLRLHFKRF